MSAYEELKAEDAKELNELRSQVDKNTKDLSRVWSHADEMFLVANGLLKGFIKLGSEQIKSPEEVAAFHHKIAELTQRLDDVDDFNEYTEIVKELGVNPNIGHDDDKEVDDGLRLPHRKIEPNGDAAKL